MHLKLYKFIIEILWRILSEAKNHCKNNRTKNILAVHIQGYKSLQLKCVHNSK